MCPFCSLHEFPNPEGNIMQFWSQLNLHHPSFRRTMFPLIPVNVKQLVDIPVSNLTPLGVEVWGYFIIGNSLIFFTPKPRKETPHVFPPSDQIKSLSTFERHVSYQVTNIPPMCCVFVCNVQKLNSCNDTKRTNTENLYRYMHQICMCEG